MVYFVQFILLLQLWRMLRLPLHLDLSSQVLQMSIFIQLFFVLLPNLLLETVQFLRAFTFTGYILANEIYRVSKIFLKLQRALLSQLDDPLATQPVGTKLIRRRMLHPHFRPILEIVLLP